MILQGGRDRQSFIRNTFFVPNKTVSCGGSPGRPMVGGESSSLAYWQRRTRDEWNSRSMAVGPVIMVPPDWCRTGLISPQ